MIGSVEGIKLGLFDNKLIGTLLVNVDGTTFDVDVGTELECLDVSFGYSKYYKF